MINIAEILKDCPKGTKLYSPICGECKFIEVAHTSHHTLITCRDKDERTVCFNEYGRFSLWQDGECILFPSKENLDWSTFNKIEFKTGDFVYVNGFVCIFAGTKKYCNEESILFFACIPWDWFNCSRPKECVYIHQNADVGIGDLGKTARLATEAEKNMLLEAIKCKGYEWDAEKLELRVREPEFKVFDRVLVRNHVSCPWNLAEYAFRDQKAPVFKYYTVGGSGWWKYCIPYEGNEHLLGKTENC